jgi:hypothetical protein
MGWEEWGDPPSPIRGDMALAHFRDHDSDADVRVSASFVDREVATPAWLALVVAMSNERVVSLSALGYESPVDAVNTEAVVGETVIRRMTRAIRNGPWMLFVTVSAPREDFAARGGLLLATALSFRALQPSRHPAEPRTLHALDGEPAITFLAPQSWTAPDPAAESPRRARTRRTLLLKEAEATLGMLRVSVSNPGAVSPQRALSALLGPMRQSGTRFEGVPIVACGPDARWSQRFLAEVSGSHGEMLLTGYFHFLSSASGDVAVWSVSCSRDTHPVAWALARRAGEIAAMSATIIHPDGHD